MNITLLPTTGKITARIFENPLLKILPAIFFDIEIPIIPFEFRNETIETSFRSELIDFDVVDWRDLSNKEFVFPDDPLENPIDASVYLDHAHNPIDVLKIAFGEFSGDTVPVNLKMNFDFTYEGPEELGVVSVSWQTDLSFSRVELDAVFEEPK